MSSTASTVYSPTLSICIATFNRASVLKATLDRMLSQITDDCEIVVSDNASSDDTEETVAEYTRRLPQVRYTRQVQNVGVDRNFDRAVEFARGRYCWLMPDDDMIRPGAIRLVLNAIANNYSAIFVNAEARNHDMSRVVVGSCILGERDSVHTPDELDSLFLRCYLLAQYIGAVVIQRSIWIERDRKSYFGSWYIHIGVVFQKPLPGNALVIAAPCMSIRVGAQSWMISHFEVVMVSLHTLIWALPLSEDVKTRTYGRIPWRRLRDILFSRAMGGYSLLEYRKFIKPRQSLLEGAFMPFIVALIPRVVANSILILSLHARKRGDTACELLLEFLRRSDFYIFR